MKRYSLIMTCSLVFFSPPAWAAHSPNFEASFSKVTGNVTVLNGKGGGRGAREDMGIVVGETVRVGVAGKAALTMFDGSRLELSPNTELVIKKLEHPSKKEKNINFLLASGGIRAFVEKLLTPRSSFEIQAGGVVCGVRGTEFSMDYDLLQEKLDLRVQKGSVYAKSRGKSYVLEAGEEMEFIQGLPRAHPSQSGPSRAAKDSLEDLSAREVKPKSLALMDLDAQFISSFSITGISLAGNSTNGGLSLSGFGLSPVGSVLPGIGQVLTKGGKPLILGLP